MPAFTLNDVAHPARIDNAGIHIIADVSLTRAGS